MNDRYLSLLHALNIEQRRAKNLEDEKKNLILLITALVHDAESFFQFHSVAKRQQMEQTIEVAKKIIGND